MAHLTYRVGVTRDESRPSGTPSIEITAYIDRVPETDAPEFGRLSRAYKGVWNSRLQYKSDFESSSEALAAIETGYPEVDHIRCYEWSVDYEYPNEMASLYRKGNKWSPGETPFPGSPPPQLARQVGWVDPTTKPSPGDTNATVTQRRAALALGLDPTLPPLAALAEWKARRSRLVMHERVTGAKAAFGNSRTGADVDIGLFPTLLWHRCDGGRFIGSGSVVVMRDPDTGWVNASIYRVHVHGPDRVVIQFDHPRGGTARSSPSAGGSAAGALRSRSFSGPIRPCSSPASSISPGDFGIRLRRRHQRAARWRSSPA